MKSTISLVIAAALSSSPFALAEHGFGPNQIKLISNKLRPIDLLKNGLEADVSEQCLSEAEELDNNSNLLDAFVAINLCPYTQDGNTFEVDFSSCPAEEAYKIACTAAGGKTAIIPNLRLVCEFNGREFEMIYSNSIECLGQSCPETLLDEETLRQLEDGIETVFGDFGDCTASSSSAVSLNAVVMASGVFLFLATFL